MPSCAAMPPVSVIIPTCNRPDLLRRAVASVRAQSVHDLDLVLVDDGDGAGAALARQGVFGPVSVDETGGAGQVAARNLGISAARARIIAFLDDDDWWADEHHLAGLLEAVGTHRFAYASGRIVVARAGEAAEMLPFSAHADAASLRRDNTLMVPGIAYPRDLHARLGPFDAALPYYWDWDWYLRVAAAGVPFRASGGGGVRVSASGDSVSSARNEAARRDDLARLCAKHGLTGVALKNHEGIAREQGAGRGG